MLGKTHAAASVCAGFGLAVAVAENPLTGAVIIGKSWLGSLLPDIDHKNSKISKKLKLTGFIVRLFTGHRALFHNPLLYAAVYAALWHFRPDLAKFLIPLFIPQIHAYASLYAIPISVYEIQAFGFLLHVQLFYLHKTRMELLTIAFFFVQYI